MKAETKKHIKKYDKERKKKLREEQDALIRLDNKKNNLQTESDRSFNAVEFYEKLSPQEKRDFDLQLQRQEIKQNYINYLKYVYGDNYILTKFHSLLAKICQSVVEKIEKGEKVKIMISVPPQHGKSMTLTETLPTWFMGRNPDLRCIITAYNADIAEKFGDKNRQLFKRVAKDLFDLEVSDSQDNKTLWNVKNHLGGLYSTGILGSLTSNNGSLIIVDDPFKNGKEADNKDIRDTVYDTFLDSVSTRARGKGNAIIVIHTRWHEDDLIGRLKKQDGWLYVNIPCVWEKGIDKLLGRKIGETLCPELGYDSNWANSMQKLLGPRKWNALYQGKPFADKGEYVQRDWLRFYNDSSKPTSFDQITLSCDPSGGGLKRDSDPTCISIWGRNGANHYLLTKVSRKMGFLEQLNEIKKLCAIYPEMKKKIVEHKANGDAIIAKLNNEIGGFVPFDPKGKSKEERLSVVLPYIEAGNVYLPEDDEETVQELIKFPHGEHDDFVDTLSQYLLNYEYRHGGKIEIDNRYSRFARAIRGLKI